MRSAVGMAGDIDSVISQLNQTVETIKQAVIEQGNATNEITSTVAKSSAHCADVAGDVRGIAQAMSDTGNSMELLVSDSDTIDQQSTLLENQVNNFLSDLKNR